MTNDPALSRNCPQQVHGYSIIAWAPAAQCGGEEKQLGKEGAFDRTQLLSLAYLLV